MLCPHCGHDGTPFLERKPFQVITESRQHLGAYCLACKRWIKWVPQTEEWLTAFFEQTSNRVRES